jgi:hypothetical protein
MSVKEIEEVDEENENVNVLIENTLYSNVFSVYTSDADAYIEFLQIPPRNGVIPATRIYLSPKNLMELSDLISDSLKELDTD